MTAHEQIHEQNYEQKPDSELTLGEKIKEIRKEENLTQEELAERSGVSKSSISDYERGKHPPTLENMTKIARYFNVSMDYFCGLE